MRRRVAMVAMCLTALVVGRGCGRKTKAVTAGPSARGHRSLGTVHRSEQVPNSVQFFVEPCTEARPEVKEGERVPKSVWTCTGTIEVPTRAADESSLAAWAKHPRLGATYFKGTVGGDPSESFILVVYRPMSGPASWNVHLFRSCKGGEWRAAALISGLQFKDSRTRISSAEMPDAISLTLKNEGGRELVRFKL